MSCGITNYCIVSLNGIASLPNFMKIYQAVQKSLVGDHRQTGDLISLLSFLESMLKIIHHGKAGLLKDYIVVISM
jgi:hypothetical protein